MLLPDSYTESFLDADTTVELMPSLTWHLDAENNRISGTTDGTDALKQAVFLMLATEAGAYDIYTDDYGRSLNDLIGKNVDYVQSCIKREVRMALLADARVGDVKNFAFTVDGGHVTDARPEFRRRYDAGCGGRQQAHALYGRVPLSNAGWCFSAGALGIWRAAPVGCVSPGRPGTVIPLGDRRAAGGTVSRIAICNSTGIGRRVSGSAPAAGSVDV